MASDIELLFGVKGGSNINGESGKGILKELLKIVNTIESRGTTQLKFTVDPKSIKDIEQKINAATSSNTKSTKEEIQLQKLLNETKKNQTDSDISGNKIKESQHKANTVAIREEINTTKELEHTHSQAAKKAETLGKSLKDVLGDTLASAVAIGTNLIQKYLLEVYDNVVQIDTAMTELKKTTDETNSSYSNFLTNANSRAQQLGANITDVVTATTEYARLGYSIEDASELADASIVYAHLGDGTGNITEASESIMSTMKAFNIEAKDSMSIVDKFSEVGKHLCPAA